MRFITSHGGPGIFTIISSGMSAHSYVALKCTLGNAMMAHNRQALLKWRRESSRCNDPYMTCNFEQYFNKLREDITCANYNVLYDAIQHGHLNVVKFLHSCGANLHEHDEELLMCGMEKQLRSQ